jgi:hypothetical protein
MLKSTAQIKISTSYSSGHAMTVIKVSIPLKPMEFLKGKNLINCIADDALPDISGLTE